MPKLVLSMQSGARPSDVQASVMSDPAVTDAVETRQTNHVIVTVPELNPAVRRRLANLPGVDRVFDDIQAIPQVADEEAVEDFLNRVREKRGEEAPPVLETRPTTGDGPDVRTDGGAVVQPIEAGGVQRLGSPQAQVTDVDGTISSIGVPELHDRGIVGENVVSVILDTGMCASAIRDDRRLAGADLTGENDPWTPIDPHGGMTGGIMAGDETTPGISTGILPGSDVFPIKTTLAGSELLQAQDVIVDVVNETGKPVIVNNSWGFLECAGLCEHPVTVGIDAVARHPAVIQVFAAGNQAVQCGQSCDGSTVGINGPSSLNSVISVGASGRDGETSELQQYSSRGGSGQVSCGQQKPDITAPTYGVAPYGCGVQNMGNTGGTSAACPHVAGVIGLIVDQRGALSRDAVMEGLAATADQFVGEAEFNGCSGYGNVVAADALDETPSEPITAGFGDTATVATGAIALGILGAALRRRFT